ncbi:MAG: MG2 domain-containing protein [Bacteroidales bacterium]|jgi:signal peptidase I|nr:MG2 domain-containing protein [Bacteroidales bacterium]MCI1785543.1 MG2 domain-containing protein [Bacteroidales bacterium]
MKKLLVSFILASVICFTAVGAGRSHALVADWKDYKAALKADLPEKQAEILNKIKSEAKSRHLSWDFYDAWVKYIDVERSVNWKTGDSLVTVFGNEAAVFGEPIVEVSYIVSYSGKSSGDILNYVMSHRDRLQNAANSQFYKTLGSGSADISVIMGNYISDDYEYSLWLLLYRSGGADVRVSKEMEKYSAGKYPDEFFYEYYLATLKPYDPYGTAMRKLSEKYKGTAAGFYPAARLVVLEADSLKEAGAGQDEYVKFLKKCRVFEKKRKSLSGKDKKIAAGCLSVSDMIKELKSKSISLYSDSDTVSVYLRNLKNVKVKVGKKEKSDSPGKYPFLKRLVNKSGSFYVYDTLYLVLPRMDDGGYEINAISGSVSGSLAYEKHTISLAVRNDNGEPAVYAADYITGKPVSACDISLYEGGNLLALVKNLDFTDGFAGIPGFDSLRTGLKSSFCSVKCSYKDNEGYYHDSKTVAFYCGQAADSKKALFPKISCNIYKDRGIYKPGDTVKFKAVLFSRDSMEKAQVLPAGKEVKALLWGPGNEILDSLVLSTNDFGSAAGTFVLPSGLKNGWFYIEMKYGGESSRSWLRVDDVELPSFYVKFDHPDDLYLPGDTVKVKGRIGSYSVNAISSLAVRYRVISGNKVFAEGSLLPGRDGSFSLSFVSDSLSDYKRYSVELRLVDETGETSEYSKVLSVSSSLSVVLTPLSRTDGSAQITYSPGHGKERQRARIPVSVAVVGKSPFRFRFAVMNSGSDIVHAYVKYTVTDNEGNVIFSGKVASGSDRAFDFSGYPQGVYKLKASASVRNSSGKVRKAFSGYDMVKVNDSDTVLNAPVKNFFRAISPEENTDGRIKVMFGSSDGPVWAVAELCGSDSGILESGLIHLSGESGRRGSLETLSFDYKKEYPDVLSFRIFYFKDSGKKVFECRFYRKKTDNRLPLSFSSFEDRTFPDSRYKFSVKTLPGVECLAAIFDKSSESFASNQWYRAVPDSPVSRCCEISSAAGVEGGRFYGSGALPYSDFFIRGTSSGKNYTKTVSNVEASLSGSEDLSMSEDLPVRDDFASTLAFLPSLHSDKQGALDFSFETSGRLSTYVVSLFAHDKSMRNSVLRKDMLVSLPVKVDFLCPEYLYAGDRFDLEAKVSADTEKPVSGVLSLYIYNGSDYKNSDPVSARSVRLSVPAGGSSSYSFPVESYVPESDSLPDSMPDYRPADTLGLKLVFVSDAGDGTERRFSDGVFKPVPVFQDHKVLEESHSALLRSGADADSLMRVLRGEFVNMSSYGAKVTYCSIADMVKAVISGKAESSGNNVLDLSEEYYSRLLIDKLRSSYKDSQDDGLSDLRDSLLLARMLDFRNADGGFAWFAGMRSSPVITAVLLERFAKMRDAGLFPDSAMRQLFTAYSLSDVSVAASAVRYLDGNLFGPDDSRSRFGTISYSRYLYVRSLYPEVEFDAESFSGNPASRKELAGFKKYVKGYLLPGKDRGLNGQIVAKSCRIKILMNLLSSNEGVSLASSFGIGRSSVPMLAKSVESDVSSMIEYAVGYKDGGIYYPGVSKNPEGLFEGGIYTHSMIADMFSSYAGYSGRFLSVPESQKTEVLKIAEGIRIWLAIRKETQQWGNGPAFIDAVNTIMSGSGDIGSLKVVIMTKSSLTPFRNIKASGNGFTVVRKFFRETVSAENSVSGVAGAAGGLSNGKISLVEIKPGDMLNKGDKILARYDIWSEANRSFVKLTAPREAAFRPVDQLSGLYGLRYRPIHSDETHSVVPQGYRDVKTTATEYYFDTYPEEKSCVTEEFFVTRTGSFTAPVIEIESLYSPHYRANDSFSGAIGIPGSE